MSLVDMTIIEEISDFNKFKSLKKDWNELLQKSDSDTIFLRHEWCSTWWESFGKNKSLFIMVMKEDGRIIGIAPLMISRLVFSGLPARAVRFIGTGESDRADFIFLKGKEDYLKEFIARLIEKSYLWDLIYLREMPSTSPGLVSLMNFLKNNNFLYESKVVSLCPYFHLPEDYDDFLKGLKKSQRQNVRNRERRLQKQGKMEFKRFTDCDNFEDLFSIAAEIERRSWKVKEKKGIFLNKPY